jgi:hypothetical protein
VPKADIELLLGRDKSQCREVAGAFVKP